MSTQKSYEDLLSLLYVDLPEIGRITEKMRNLTIDESNRFRGSVRISLGKIWTDDEFENYRNSVLSKPLT